jgi:hypothetical protein
MFFSSKDIFDSWLQNWHIKCDRDKYYQTNDLAFNSLGNLPKLFIGVVIDTITLPYYSACSMVSQWSDFSEAAVTGIDE